MQIIHIIEKPARPRYPYRGCGIYLFRPEIFSYIKKTPVSSIRNEREITHTLQLLTREKRVYGYLIKGSNINIYQKIKRLRPLDICLCQVYKAANYSILKWKWQKSLQKWLELIGFNNPKHIRKIEAQLGPLRPWPDNQNCTLIAILLNWWPYGL